MPTIVLEATAEPARTQRSRERFWVSIVAQIPEKLGTVMRVFVARKVEAGKRFRTLVWPARLDAGEPLISLVDDCFYALLGGASFSSRKLDINRHLLILDGRVNETIVDDDELPPERPNEVDIASQIRDIDFFRLDYQTPEGIAGFSCRALGRNEEYELTMMLEEPLAYSNNCLKWACSKHRIPELRDWKNVDCGEVEQFLNHDWSVSAAATSSSRSWPG